jgi:hypothetical protein
VCVFMCVCVYPALHAVLDRMCHTARTPLGTKAAQTRGMSSHPSLYNHVRTPYGEAQIRAGAPHVFEQLIHPLAPVVERLCDARTLRLYRPSVSQPPRHPDSAVSPALFRRRRVENSALPPAHTADLNSPHGGGTGRTPRITAPHASHGRPSGACCCRPHVSTRAPQTLAARASLIPSPSPSSCANCRPRISALREDTRGVNEAWGRIERYIPHEYADTHA